MLNWKQRAPLFTSPEAVLLDGYLGISFGKTLSDAISTFGEMDKIPGIPGNLGHLTLNVVMEDHSKSRLKAIGEKREEISSGGREEILNAQMFAAGVAGILEKRINADTTTLESLVD